VISPRSSASEIEQCRRILIARAEFERSAMREATDDLQNASDRLARIAVAGIRLVRRYWLPMGALVAGGIFKRARPLLRAVQTGITVWQTVRLLRNARH
jgi:hypothetical protein